MKQQNQALLGKFDYNGYNYAITIFHLQMVTLTSQYVPCHIPGQRHSNSSGLGEKHLPRTHGWERQGSDSSPIDVISGVEVVVVISLVSKMVSQSGKKLCLFCVSNSHFLALK